ncbi:MAG: hypothetical protein OEY79_00630 [Anaplasmataceae bacterium]|nr:hypothetical protein [Anaplasmataceae bacterium]
MFTNPLVYKNREGEIKHSYTAYLGSDVEKEAFKQLECDISNICGHCVTKCEYTPSNDHFII